MSIKQQIAFKNTIKYSIVDDLIALFFQNKYHLFGGCVRDYIIATKKFYPIDFDIGVDNVEKAKSMLMSKLEFTFDINHYDVKDKDLRLIHSKMILTHKHIDSSEPLEFIIDISHKSVIGSNIDFDVNSIYMPSHQTFSIIDSMGNIPLMDILNNINRRKFRILKTFHRPTISRITEGITVNSTKLIEFIKIMDRTAKMLNRGWKLYHQKIEDVFDPCLIKELPSDKTNGICNICSSEYKQYELELNCCHQFICFTCALEHIKARFSNSNIFCPYCRGDPFGWGTCTISGIHAAVSQMNAVTLIGTYSDGANVIPDIIINSNSIPDADNDMDNVD